MTNKSLSFTTGLRGRDVVLIVLTICSLVVIFCFPKVAQDPSFHNFIDQREFFGIANFYNVITNLPFVIVGLAGMILFLRTHANQPGSLNRILLFASVVAIGFGSAWYHYNPGNATLVWDRIPMTLTFMSYLSFIVGAYVSRRLGSLMLIPSLILGAISVWYWYITEQNGNGDLRLYFWVQFFPMLCIPLIAFLYPAPKSIKVKIITVIAVYAIAKVAEAADKQIYDFHQLISGHSLKHLIAAISVLIILMSSLEKTDSSTLEKTN